MQFFFLVIINIFMWVIFYLVISLKLEKTASEFREKKLRKIMDDIMREFNSIADRNISILEKRIAVLKKLMEKSGGYGGIDIMCEDEREMQGMGDGRLSSENSGEKTEGPDVQVVGEPLAGSDILDKMKEASKSYLERARSLLSKPAAGDENHSPGEMKSAKIIKDMTRKTGEAPGEGGGTVFADLFCLETDPRTSRESDAEHEVHAQTAGDEEPVQEGEEKLQEEINRMFIQTTDKYTLIKELHGRGYPAEDISKYSGIPLGEITLVLNLRDV